MRPITLLSCVVKILERMINECLIWLAENERWFDHMQNGFRQGRSCVDNLAKLITDIEISIETNENLLVAFLDIKSAYDNVRRDLLCDILNRKNCPSKIIKFVDDWMRDRRTLFIISSEELKVGL